MNRWILFALAASLLGTTSQAADRNGEYAIKGVGLANCEQFTAARTEQSNVFWMFMGWLDGYLSAANRLSEDTFDLVAWESTDLLATVIDGHCKQNPQDQFEPVARSIVAQLAEERLRNRSKLVVARTDSGGLALYRDALRRAQQALSALKHYTGEPDGLYGPATRQALEDFQRANGLKVTGLPDQVTLWKLLRPSAGALEPSPGKP